MVSSSRHALLEVSHGLVERVIQSLQNGLNDCSLKESRLHATGLQSLCKLVENAYNSIPIGYSYDRDQDNTSKLKIITPNMLKMGRTNQRTLDGPIRLARGSRELLDRVESLYDSWFRVWQDTVVPKLLFQPKWYDSDRDLGEGDLVFFQKKDGKLEIRWVLGRVDQVVRSERKIRRVLCAIRTRRNPLVELPTVLSGNLFVCFQLTNIKFRRIWVNCSEGLMNSKV